jgi:branched-chain amino acid transport system ATP-binding protein
MARTKRATSVKDSAPVEVSTLDKLTRGKLVIAIDDLDAGYGRANILHDFSLRLGKCQSLCLVGPNGAGKSTVLSAIQGFARIFKGSITLDGKAIASLGPSQKLKSARLAYVLQKSSVFPNMTVEENLWMGGYCLPSHADAKDAATQVLDRYRQLKARAREKAGVLSGGERRLLEIARALIMAPETLLVDEPSIGLEPRAIDMIFDTLKELRETQGTTLILVEQNARKGLEFADIGYVLVAGRVVRAAKGSELLDDPDIGRLFLGG